MASLRNRFVSTNHTNPEIAKQTNGKHDQNGGTANGTNSKTAFTTFKLYAFISVLAFLAYIAYPRVSTPLPVTYALCSKEGDKIYTVDGNNSKTQCIIVQQSYIIDTGSLRDVQRRWNNAQPRGALKKARFLDVRYIETGAIIVPGISDSHAHILEYGANQQLHLEGTQTIQDTVKLVRDFILSDLELYNDTSKFITGGGWDHTVWPTTGWPTSADLDADPIIKGRPVVLQSKDCHALWVSGKVIEASTPFPEYIEGGIIVRDDNGHPTGVLLDNAQDLLKQPILDDNDLLRRFKVTVRDAHAYGITTIHDAGLDPASLAFFKRQAELGTLPIRIYGMTYFNENADYWGNQTVPLIGGDGDRLIARSVKIFADGALRTGGAALHDPYTDNPSTNGFMRLDSQVLFDVIPMFLRDGWQVNVHAVGDRANGIVLDAFEASLADIDVVSLRPRLEHAQLMTKSDMMRLGRLGVIASVQPTHAISDMWYAENRLGPERVRGLYAFRSLVDSGARIALGSDAPVETLNPLSGFYAAITRLSADGKSPHGSVGWFPEQRLTREEALRGMTIDATYASFTEKNLGSLEIGKRADYVVLSQDIMTIPAAEILATKTLATVMDGRPVYGRV